MYHCSRICLSLEMRNRYGFGWIGHRERDMGPGRVESVMSLVR